MGEEGRSFLVLGVNAGVSADEGDETTLVEAGGGFAPCEVRLGDVAPRPRGRGAGGGRLREGRSVVPPSSKTFLRAAISWRKARFSDCVEPSSERIASSRRSRSAISPSRVEMYSIVRLANVKEKRRDRWTFTTNTKVPCTDLVPKLSLLFARHFCKDFGRRTPVLRDVVFIFVHK